MGLFERLRSAGQQEWDDYTQHAFVRQLGGGSLPSQAFREYLVQDYLFLVQFARAHALAAFKSRSLADIADQHAALGAILAETRLHVALTQRWGISPEELVASPERQATVAYTRYVLDCGMAGDLLDLNVALAPCAIGYAEIAAALAPALENRRDHPYREWIAEYADEGFQEASRAAVARLDALADGPISERRFAELLRIFRTASRLEADFWQQALDAAADVRR